MAHGPSVLEMIKFYETNNKKFCKITEDILTNHTEYYGVLHIDKNLDLLFGLFPNEKINGIYAAIYRGWPLSCEASNKPIVIYLSQALKMFPEIKQVKFEKDKWPPPYNNPKEIKNDKS